jgi:hypothetical protein
VDLGNNELAIDGLIISNVSLLQNLRWGVLKYTERPNGVG